MNTTNEGLSRRGFFKGALAVGTMAAAGLGLTGCGTPKVADPASASTAVSDTSAATGWSWLTQPAAIPDSEIEDNLTCDVLIIGAGTAGTSAALYAGVAGIDAIVMQKTESIQTNGQGYASWNDEWGTAQGIEWDIPGTLQGFANLASGKANLKLVRNVIERTGEASRLIIDNIPEPQASPAIVDGYVAYRWLYDNDVATRYKGYADLMRNMGEKAASQGVRFLFQTPAVQLVLDEQGAVIGAIGESVDGGYVKVLAHKGVVLATGDMSDSEEMLEAYCPVMLDMPTLHAVPCNTGDGHKMGMWAGGRLDPPMTGLMMHFDPSPLPYGAAPFSALPWLHVNVKGERFTNENIGYQALASAVALQPEHRAFQIIDSHLLEHAFEYTNGGRPGDEAALEGAVAAGSILKADSLDELAQLAGLNAETLKKTVERYNSLVDKGFDEDFGMDSEFFVFNGIKDAPFYAIERMPAKLALCNGLVCNEYCQVLNKDDQPIPGLFAAGNVQGSFFGYDYPVVGFGGLSLARASAGGILAVKSAMGTFEEPIV
ncbi:MAG: FAD-binding protein [Coriobacteriales bacterium]|jgi:succinate dehydrogenase/fumarate reductase flavoprotein subunit|nr:FAD-binding protein [Coriobacteriales bacterium]